MFLCNLLSEVWKQCSEEVNKKLCHPVKMIHTHKDLQAEEHARWKEKRKKKPCTCYTDNCQTSGIWVITNLRVKILVTLSCPTLCDPMDCSLSGSSVCGILQARILEWVAISFSRRSSRPRDWTQISCAAGGFFTIWATKQAQLPTSRWDLSLETSDLPKTKCPDLSGLCVDGSAHLVTKQPPIHGAPAPVLITISKTGFFL